MKNPSVSPKRGVGRPRLPRGVAADTWLQVRVRRAEKTRYAGIAAGRGMTLSAWCIEAIESAAVLAEE